ncbi:MAG: hypothetical protein KDD64_16590, partial [Bdellovibrionales bacterium]|nr:hypothetical protein [Bdellovibrionales bacterium]
VLCCGKPMADELVALFPEAASSLDEGSVTCFTTDPISPFNRISKTLLDSSITCRVVSLEEKVQIDLGEAKRRGLALSRS